MSTSTSLRPSLAPYEAYPLQDLLGRTARRLPDKVAVIDGERRFTYRQLDDYSGRFAAALTRLGISKGERVGILAPNCAEFIIAFYGIVKAGAVVTTVNTGYREREISHQLNDSGAEVVVVHASLLQTAEVARDAIPALGRLIVIGADIGGPGFILGPPGKPSGHAPIGRPRPQNGPRRPPLFQRDDGSLQGRHVDPPQPHGKRASADRPRGRGRGTT